MMSMNKKILIGLFLAVFIALLYQYFNFQYSDLKTMNTVLAISAMLLAVSLSEGYRESKDLYKNLLSEADWYFKNNNAMRARQIFESLVKIKPRSYEALLGLGQCNRILREVRTAEQIFKRAIKLEPERHEAYLFLGITQFNMKQTGEALMAFKKAKMLHPFDADVYYFMAKLYERLRDSEDAISHYKAYLELNPNTRNGVEVTERIKRLEAGIATPAEV
ncbi:MAG: tetratricopeptide repeat protein [Candidatus Eremiobacteraeota bacterium]|nr:tetratricopeptide repeat protein [Candidatus Eremiobacteraeota bacterium]